MKKTYTLLLSYSLVFLGGSSLHGIEGKAISQQGQTLQLDEKYVNKEKKYSIAYPKSWQKKEIPALDLVLLAPAKGEAELNAATQINASMNVISEKPDAPINLDQFFNESLENIKKELKEVNVKETGERTLNGVNSKWVLYNHVMKDITFTVLQYFMVVDDHVYLLTFSSAANHYNEYRSDFEAIAGTFQRLNDES